MTYFYISEVKIAAEENLEFWGPSFQFREDKNKAIVSGTKRKSMYLDELDIKCSDIKIKQHTNVTYLGYILHNVSDESMTTKVSVKIIW